MSADPTGPRPDAAPDPGPHARPAGPEAAEYPHDAPVLLEEDETVPPRPEEEVADLLRGEPDRH
ncbi:MAG: hypothetical protein ACYC1Z_08005 [Georgenia sp.]